MTRPDPDCDFCHGQPAANWIGDPSPRAVPCPRCGGVVRSGRSSRRKGQRGEREFIALHLAPYWPDAKRNLDQFGDDKRDAINCAGAHFQIKRTERLDLWAAIRQAETEAIGNAVPIVAFRRNRSSWYCALRADYLTALLAWREDDV